MAGYLALAAAGRSLVGLLNLRFGQIIPPGDRKPTAVLAGTVDFDKVNSSPTAVIRYPAVPSTATGSAWTRYQARLVSGRQRGRHPAAASPHALSPRGLGHSGRERTGLARARRGVLESQPILTGPALDPIGQWEPGDAIQIVPDDLALDSMSEAFQALTTQYRLSLPYVAKVIRISDGPSPRSKAWPRWRAPSQRRRAMIIQTAIGRPG